MVSFAAGGAWMVAFAFDPHFQDQSFLEYWVWLLVLGVQMTAMVFVPFVALLALMEGFALRDRSRRE